MRLLPLLFVLILTACVLTAPDKGAKPGATAENPITGGAITVTTLDAAMPAQDNVPRPKPKPTATAPKPDAVQPSPEDPTPKPTAKPTVADLAAEVPAALPRVMSPEEKSCMKKGGRWAQAGKSGAKTCIKLTKDGGKQCNSESDCEGYCLARSGTCAPAIPMFGCNDILQDNGVQVTLCID